MICSPADIKAAAAKLEAGELVAFPTETVYGLGANALLDASVAAIYATKERPQFNPLIVHLPSIEAAKPYVRWTELAEKLASTFWPGALTLVLERASNCPLSLLVSAGMDTVAIRVPNHAVACELLAAAGVPVAAPSANRSGRISPTQASHVRDEFGDSITLLDGGPCMLGLESTVVDARGEQPILLRPGCITLEALAVVAGGAQHAQPGGPKTSPGMLESHYAPDKKLRLNATSVHAGEALLAFGPDVPEGAQQVLNLSVSGNLQEAAANLFSMLRRLDAGSAKSIAAMGIPDTGVGLAINDRLARAASGKKA